LQYKIDQNCRESVIQNKVDILFGMTFMQLIFQMVSKYLMIVREDSQFDCLRFLFMNETKNVEKMTDLEGMMRAAKNKPQ